MSTEKPTVPVNTPVNESGETRINIRALAHCLLKNWWWYAISVVVIVGGTAFYLKKTNTTTVTYAQVMFNQDDEDGPSAGGLMGSLMSSFNMGGNGVNVTDEIVRMQSHSAIKRVVQTLELNKYYTGSSSFWRKNILYFQNSPIEIDCPQSMLDTISGTTLFKLKIRDKGKKLHLTVKQDIYKTVFDKDIPKLPYTVATPLGKFTIIPTSFYRPETDLTFKAELSNLDDAAKINFRNIDVYLAEKKSNAVIIKVDDQNAKRAKAIANTLIELYNEHSMSDRSARSKATLEFLNDRLHKMYTELEKSGSGIANYKENHHVVNPEAEAEYIFKMKQDATAGLLEQETQLGILNMLRDFLTTSENRQSLLPVTSISNQNSDGTNTAINNYNEMVLELMRLKASAKGNNSTMRQLESQIEAMRTNLLTSLDRSISAMKISIARSNKENGTVNSRISSIPRIEQELTNMLRDNEIKNRIYAYLLQKREEAEVKLARTLPTGVTIDEAWTDPESAKPSKMMLLATSFLFALLIPTLVLISLKRREYLISDKYTLRNQEDEIKKEIG